MCMGGDGWMMERRCGFEFQESGSRKLGEEKFSRGEDSSGSRLKSAGWFPLC